MPIYRRAKSAKNTKLTVSAVSANNYGKTQTVTVINNVSVS